MRNVVHVSLCLSILATVACSRAVTRPGDVDSAGLGETPAPATEIDMQAPNGNTLAEPCLDEQVSGAVKDLAERTGLAVDAISVREARTVTWGSGAVGCPRKGMNYTQAIVPGVLVLLEANGKVYRYHGREARNLFHCPDERAQAPAYGQGHEFM